MSCVAVCRLANSIRVRNSYFLRQIAPATQNDGSHKITPLYGVERNCFYLGYRIFFSAERERPPCRVGNLPSP